jgi:hypothetical protein
MPLRGSQDTKSPTRGKVETNTFNMDKQEQIIKLHDEGFSAGKIAQKLKVKKSVVQDVLGDNAKSSGLGDTISKITEATGLDVVADKVAKVVGADDCGCKARAKTLNKLFPYKRMNDLSLEDSAYLDTFFSENQTSIKMDTQKILVDIYNRVFNAKRKTTTCGQCVASLVRDLRKVYDATKD